MLAVGSTPTCCLPPLDGLGGVTEIHPGNYVFYDTAMFALGACARQGKKQTQEAISRNGVSGVSDDSLSNSFSPPPPLPESMLSTEEGGGGSTDDVAVRVLTRVVGHYPNSNMLLVDMGWTAQGGGQGQALDYGTFTHRVWLPKRRPRAPTDVLPPSSLSSVAEDDSNGGGASEEAGGGGEYEEPPEVNAQLNLKVACLKQECGEVTTTDGSPLDFDRFPVGCVLAFAPYHSCATGHNHPSLLVLEGGEVTAELEVAKGW